ATTPHRAGRWRRAGGAGAGTARSGARERTCAAPGAPATARGTDTADARLHRCRSPGDGQLDLDISIRRAMRAGWPTPGTAAPGPDRPGRRRARRRTRTRAPDGAARNRVGPDHHAEAAR